MLSVGVEGPGPAFGLYSCESKVLDVRDGAGLDDLLLLSVCALDGAVNAI
jgi:hypothetical protein